jgi:hypothetical protein
MIRDVAEVVGAIASAIGAKTDIGEEVIGTDQICTSSMVVAVKLLKSVVQVIWVMVNMRLSATTVESRMMIIWFAWVAIRILPTWRANVEERWSVVYLGVCPR